MWPRSRLLAARLGTRLQPRAPLSRGPYQRLKDKHVAFFQTILDSHRVLTDPSDVEPYNTDWFGTSKGESRLVLRPKSVDEVSAVLRYCQSESLAVTPQGGNTGLVAGAVPVFDEVILSMGLLNRIGTIDPIAGTVEAGAGVVLEKMSGRLSEAGLMPPYDLGSKGSCQLGGNVATCAGGLRLVRYGTMLANLLGLRAVLSDGSVLDLMTTLRKDNTGYHLRQIFVGSEGTLGVVTDVALLCPPLPASVTLSFLGLTGYGGVIEVYKLVKSRLSEILSSCEMMDAHCMESVVSKLGLRSPLGEHAFYMLVETHGSDTDRDSDRVTAFLDEALRCGAITDATLITEPSRMKEVWKVRERIVDALKTGEHLYTYDVTMPVVRCYEAVHVAREHFKSDPRVTSVSGFGHIGDGNLHLNLTSASYDRGLEEEIEAVVYPWISGQGGSISSEHGIGARKRDKLAFGKSARAIRLMAELKKTLDPKGILNPYKVIPESF